MLESLSGLMWWLRKSRLVCLQSRSVSILGARLGGLLGQQHRLDVGKDTALCNGDTAEQLVQLFIISDCELEMAGIDSCLLVVSGSITSQLQDFCCKVLHHCRQVDRGPSTHAFAVVALLQEAVDSTHGKLKSGPGGSASLGLASGLAALSASRHDWLLYRCFTDQRNWKAFWYFLGNDTPGIVRRLLMEFSGILNAPITVLLAWTRPGSAEHPRRGWPAEVWSHPPTEIIQLTAQEKQTIKPKQGPIKKYLKTRQRQNTKKWQTSGFLWFVLGFFAR